MKKIFTILILTITVTNIYSQKIDYSRDSTVIYDQLMEAKMYERRVEYFDSLIIDELKEPSVGAGNYYQYAADAKIKLGDIDGAIDYLIKATKDDGGLLGKIPMNTASYYNSLSSLYLNYNHNYKQAHICIDSALILDYSFIHVEQKVKIFNLQNNKEEAVFFINKMIDEHPYDMLVYKIKSQLFIKQNKFAEAIAVMDIAVSKRKEYNAPNAFYWRAKTKEEALKYDDAIVDYQKCQELEPEKGRGYSGLCDIYIKQNKYIKAHEYIDKAIKLEPKDIEYLLTKSFFVGFSCNRFWM